MPPAIKIIETYGLSKTFLHVHVLSHLPDKHHWVSIDYGLAKSLWGQAVKQM